ncbi:MAG: NAD-dependent succinate-semialdehyde dehydrogenase [bacterium]|nr:NAD-dependent succinate-semialdehyde dehydrogenase [bacterium]
MILEAINPATGEIIKTYKPDSPEAVSEKIQQSHTAFASWRSTPFAQRAEWMEKVATILEANARPFALLMAEEMGKVVREGMAEIKKCAWVCRYYATEAEAFLKAQPTATDAKYSFVSFLPLGPVLAVMPWNFPFWQVFRFAAPNLMAGNTGLLKHASNVPGCALAIEAIFREAGFPDGVFQTLLVGSKAVDTVIENPLVKAVTLTGSTPAGRAVARKAGECLKKTVLELGGSDPYIILEDADLDHAVPLCVTSRMLNAGQSCIAAKRFIIHQAVYAEFETRMVDQMRQIQIGDPTLDETPLGPMARADLRKELHTQVLDSIEQGAQLLLGGVIPDRPGAYYPPTVLSQVRPGMTAFEEELFGPVAALIQTQDEAEAIALANQSTFGLGAAVFTRDRARGERIAETELEAGCCFVNDFVRSDPRLPFGGIKASGYGRELAAFGIHEFVNIKTVYIQ